MATKLSPMQGESPSIHFRVPAGLKKEFVARCERTGDQPADIMREILEAYLWSEVSKDGLYGEFTAPHGVQL